MIEAVAFWGWPLEAEEIDVSFAGWLFGTIEAGFTVAMKIVLRLL